MKVQSQVQQPPVSQAQNSAPAAPTAKAADAAPAGQAGKADASLLNAGQLKDQFVPGKPGKPPMPGIIDCFPPFDPKPKDTMSLRDHLTASKLPEALNNPLNKELLEHGNKDVQLTRDDQGVMRGPDGQPLAKVGLEDGTTAYVDPNTNQYYLTDEHSFFGDVNAVGPLDLPEGAQFSNSYFSDKDVQAIQRDAARGGGFPFPRPPIDPIPLPLPRPGPIPLPLPEPRPFPRDPWGPVLPKFDPSVLLAAGGAGKHNGIE